LVLNDIVIKQEDKKVIKICKSNQYLCYAKLFFNQTVA